VGNHGPCFNNIQGIITPLTKIIFYNLNTILDGMKENKIPKITNVRRIEPCPSYYHYFLWPSFKHPIIFYHIVSHESRLISIKKIYVKHNNP
jgi:hypothetical protein